MYVKQDALDGINGKMGAFAPMHLVKTLTEDIDDLVNKEEFYKINHEL